MNCQRCGDEIEKGEEKDHFGRLLCEDCYMDALSPSRTCDPWAVHSAKSFPKDGIQSPALNALQQKIIDILKETGGVEPGVLVERSGVKPTDLEREIAALRHMEKIRAELREGRRFIVLW